MELKTFDEASADLVLALNKLEIPKTQAGLIIDLQRGPFAHCDSIATMWEYYHMTPGSPATSYDQLVHKMELAAKQWAITHTAFTQLKIDSDGTHPQGVHWENLLAEYDKRMLQGHGISNACRSSIVEGTKLAQSGQFLKVMTETSRVHKEAAEKNAEAFHHVQSRTKEGYGVARWRNAAGYGGHALGWGGVAVVGCAVFKTAGGAGLIAAGGAGLAIGGAGLCVYGIYRAARAGLDWD